mmetsp:Transcript_5017/g.15018  ORF Transcript_5017/g.15018 Transcript_5017/m.15018 type:complete len:221 (-) Transcript_5017:520-1182(-)
MQHKSSFAFSEVSQEDPSARHLLQVVVHLPRGFHTHLDGHHDALVDVRVLPDPPQEVLRGVEEAEDGADVLEAHRELPPQHWLHLDPVRELQALSRRLAVGSHEATCPQLHASEVPCHDHADAVQLLLLDGGEDRAARCPRRLAIIARPLLPADLIRKAVVRSRRVRLATKKLHRLVGRPHRCSNRHELGLLRLKLGSSHARNGLVPALLLATLASQPPR